MAPFEINLRPVGDYDALAALWLDVERRSEASFFLSWLWVGSWLQVLPDGLDARLLTVRRDGTVVGLGVFVVGPHGGLSPLGRRHAHLHETGDPTLDVATIEDNGLLVDRRYAAEIETAALLWLTDGERKIDRVVLGGITPDLAAMTGAIAARRRFFCDVRNDSPRPYVDLDNIRCRGGSYLASLSAN